MHPFIPFAFALTALTFTANARDIPFSYNTGSLPVHGYGHPRPDSYDICIKIDDPALRGGSVSSFSVPVPEVEGCSIRPEVTAWITGNLEADPISPSNSLAFIKVVSDGKTIEATFPEGVPIPEEGLYVGYSVEVTENANGARTFPIAVIDGTTPGSLYFRSTTLTRWDNTYYRMEYMSPMSVTIDIDLPDYAVTPSLPEKIRVARGSEAVVNLTYTNRSIEPVRSLKFCVSTPEWEEVRAIDTLTENEGGFGSCGHIDIPFQAPSANGDSYLKIDLLEVNGHPNVGEPLATSRMDLRVMPSVPVYRPLVEEYTGLWCGNCPSGWVALEEAREKYGDDFVFMTFHVNDILTPDFQQPMAPRSVPALSVDREAALGSGELDEALAGHLGRETDIDLRVRIDWADDRHEALKATASTCFMENVRGADYSVAMYLVADGLSDPSWAQANYFAGQVGKPGRFWDIFTKGGGYVFGLNYDGVAAVCYRPQGESGHIPDLIYEFETFSTTETFRLEDGVSSRGVDLIRDIDRLRVVAVLLDNKTGKVVNSATSLPVVRMAEYGDSDGVESIAYETTLESEQFYSLEGIRLTEPSPGQPCIRFRRYSDSTVSTSRILIP